MVELDSGPVATVQLQAAYSYIIAGHDDATGGGADDRYSTGTVSIDRNSRRRSAVFGDLKLLS